MIDEKAEDYANEVCEDDDNFLKIYHAYQDGWTASEPEKGINHYLIAGMFLGLCVTVLILSALKLFFNFDLIK